MCQPCKCDGKQRRVVGMSSLFPMPGSCSNSSLPNLVYISPIQSTLKHCHTTHQAWILCQKWVYSHLTFSQFILPLDLRKKLHWKLICRWYLLLVYINFYFQSFRPRKMLSVYFSEAHELSWRVFKIFFPWKSTWSSNFMLCTFRLII